MKSRPSRRALLFVFVLASAIAIAELTASCTDGVTPDCSNAAECAPSTFVGGDAGLDGTTDGGDAQLGDASNAG